MIEWKGPGRGYGYQEGQGTRRGAEKVFGRPVWSFKPQERVAGARTISRRQMVSDEKLERSGVCEAKSEGSLEKVPSVCIGEASVFIEKVGRQEGRPEVAGFTD